MKHKILLPVDFSDNSWNAVKYALQLLKNESCIFYIVNVYTPTIYNMEYMTSSTNIYDLEDITQKTSVRGLDEIKKRILNEYQNPQHQVETISSFNSLIPEIKKLVKEKEINLIVMGTKGATGAKQILFGSNTIHALKNATCPFLAIPDKFEYKKITNILFPTDYKINYDSSQINTMLEIVNTDDATLNVLNVSFGYELSENQKNSKSILESYLNKANTIYHSVPDKDLQEAINDFQLKTKIEMLIMINNKHSFFENIFFQNIIKQIGFHLNVPFLVLPTKK